MLSTILALELLCGHSDAVYGNIKKLLGEGKAKNYPIMNSMHGESGRRFYVYPDGSWFMTAEFHAPGDMPVELDITCVVDKGSPENMEGLVERDWTLPGKVLGELKRPIPFVETKPEGVDIREA